MLHGAWRMVHEGQHRRNSSERSRPGWMPLHPKSTSPPEQSHLAGTGGGGGVEAPAAAGQRPQDWRQWPRIHSSPHFPHPLCCAQLYGLPAGGSSLQACGPPAPPASGLRGWEAGAVAGSGAGSPPGPSTPSRGATEAAAVGAGGGEAAAALRVASAAAAAAAAAALAASCPTPGGTRTEARTPVGAVPGAAAAGAPPVGPPRREEATPSSEGAPRASRVEMGSAQGPPSGAGTAAVVPARAALVRGGGGPAGEGAGGMAGEGAGAWPRPGAASTRV